MSGLTQVKALISKGAEYLYQTRVCDEDHLPHGRRAYVWPLLNWLYKHDGNKEWVKKAEIVADELDPTVRHNPSGEMVIFPGLHHRRNYSTNAIDCGTFVDSFFDFKELQRGTPHPLDAKVNEVATNYILKKITGHKDVHDQYLWAATGLARFLAELEEDAKTSEYKKALENTLDFWLGLNEEDGYSPYMQSDKFMGGLTPYYFSRRIAFSWYILEKAKLRRPDIEEKLLTSAHFLARLLRPDGVKEMRLEAKRYYFWGEFEADSHPFDLYVFYKSYEKAKDEFWLDASAASFRQLLKAQIPNGAIRSRTSTQGLQDCQCDTMRTGHLAWLARLPDEYLSEISNRKVRPIRTPYRFNKASPSERVLLIGNAERWVHFVTRKGQIAGYAGERVSGLALPSGCNINNLRSPFLFHCRSRGNPLLFFRHNRPALIETFKYALFPSWDCFMHKRHVKLAFAFLKDGLFGYLFIGFFTRSTEFPTEISGLTVGANFIRHDLTLSDMSGNQKEIIGRRAKLSDGKAVISIKDTLTVSTPLNLTHQDGVTRVHGPKVIEMTYLLGG